MRRLGELLGAWERINPKDAQTTLSALRVAFPEARDRDSIAFRAFLDEASVGMLGARLFGARWQPSHQAYLETLDVTGDTYIKSYPRNLRRMLNKLQNVHCPHCGRPYLPLETINPFAGESLIALELTTRPFNGLIRAGIKTVAQLIALDHDTLLRIPNIGRTSALEIERALQRHELKLTSSPMNTGIAIDPAPNGFR